MVIDGRGGKKFQPKLEKYLKSKIDQKFRIRFKDSKKDNLLQVADMIAGAISRSYQFDKKYYPDYREKIKHREICVDLYPK